MADGTETVAVPLDVHASHGPHELPVGDGVYHVRLTSLAGATVDTATFRTDDATSASLSGIVTSNGSLPWRSPPEVVAARGEGETRLGLTIANEGAFHAEMAVAVRIPADTVWIDRVPIAPGQRARVVVKLPAAAVRSVQTAGGGSVTVELFVSSTAEEPEATIDLTLPETSS